MSKSSISSSSPKSKEKKYFYTVRDKSISDHAKKILENVEEDALSELLWTDVLKGECYDADCLVVFETGSSNSNRALDVLSGIRERVPGVKMIIAVIICTNNSKEHDKFCSSIECHAFKTEKDISFEYFIFSDGRPHKCSDGICKKIESQLNNIEEERKKREERKKTVKPAIEKKIRSKMIELAKDGDKLDDLKEAIEDFEEEGLEDKGDLEKAKKVYKERMLKKDLKDAIDKRRLVDLDKAIKNTEDSIFKDEKLTSLLSEAEALRDNLKALGKYIHPIPEMNQNIIAELRAYNQPPKEIKDVLLATFMLLGENRDNLQDWDNIRKLMVNRGEVSGNKPILQRITEFEKNKKVEISEDTYKEINSVLEKYTCDKVRKISSAAATFYNWIKDHVPCQKETVESSSKSSF